MSKLQANTTNPFRQPSPAPQRDDWEDWDDEDPNTAIVDDSPLIDLDDYTTPSGTSSSAENAKRASLQRYSVQRPVFRAKSKGHQKAKIAKAGITLDTNVSRFRQAQKAHQARSAEQNAREGNPGRFADADALKALEGSPNSASMGSFSWLKRKPGNNRVKSIKKSGMGPESDLSPVSRPIYIGIAVPEENLTEYQVSPQTAVVETPIAVQQYNQRLAAQRTGASTLSPEQQRSVWSPDTPNESPHIPRPASSIYSQPSMYGGQVDFSNAPPVPALPATYKFKQTQPAAFVEPEDDDTGTPCTLFEEDGSPLASRKSVNPRSAISPESAVSRSKGWWDAVTLSQQTNPFKPQHTGESSTSSNPFRQTPQQTGASSSSVASQAVPQEWWNGTDEKKRPVSRSDLTIATAPISQQNTARTFQSAASSSQQAPSAHTQTHSEKARILLEENQTANDEPPPYSPPKTFNEVKYGAILPPSHTQVYAMNQPMPSPGPVSPGLPGTMTSQGAISMADIPLTPRAAPAAVLPERPVGTYVTHDQFREAAGTNVSVERNRRRHEKEEFVARKVGGFWRGRGLVSENGCFGRTGREGRQRRRVWLGVCGGVLAAIILIIVLAVVLTKKSISAHTPASAAPGSAPETSAAPVETVWLNLTGFPPMPTGVLTVSGSNNSKAVDGCLVKNAKTLWSCAIPKDQQKSDALYKPNQPEFIFQIQYDNNTRALWNITNPGEQTNAPQNGDSSTSPPIRVVSRVISRATSFVKRQIVYDPGFSPKPAPPEYAEMFFLGNTTDGVKSANKAGEPTPFYISLLPSTDKPVGPDVISARGIGNGIDAAPTDGSSDWNISRIISKAEMESDGKPAPARLFPLPSQQPVRLIDRGLPTEHYSFYTYFNKTVFIAEMEQGKESPLDADGGAALKDAKEVVYWVQTRFLVQIWTRLGSSTQLLGNGNGPAPGTMPYPVTVTEDFHGGNRNDKGTWYWGLHDDKRVDTSVAELIQVDMEFEGSWINNRNQTDPSLGGSDGGTGGCKCEWVNFEAKKP